MKKTEKLAQIIAGDKIISVIRTAKNVLLVAPFVEDYRLDWASWHQPTGLLQIAAWLRKQKREVRLIDCLCPPRGKRLARSKVLTREIEGNRLHKWHFGLSMASLEARLVELQNNSWEPDCILVTSLNSVWWESTRSTVDLLKRMFPEAQVIVGGPYPTSEPQHAARHSRADVVVKGGVPDVSLLPPDLSLYDYVPYSTGLYFYTRPYPGGVLRPRGVNGVIREITAKAKIGIREFVFFDEEIRIEHRNAFGDLLSQISKVTDGFHFVLPGNVSPALITRDLAQKMCRARVTQVYLRCDYRSTADGTTYTTPLSEYQRSIDALVSNGGLDARTRDVAAMLVIGFPGEDLDLVSERLIRLAHIVGSAILVPFQYVRGVSQIPQADRLLEGKENLSPDEFNGKLFRLAALAGASFEEYMELVRLATLLNSKYRDVSFDFLGTSMTADMFRRSIGSGSWNPFGETSGKSD